MASPHQPPPFILVCPVCVVEFVVSKIPLVGSCILLQVPQQEQKVLVSLLSLFLKFGMEFPGHFWIVAAHIAFFLWEKKTTTMVTRSLKYDHLVKELICQEFYRLWLSIDFSSLYLHILSIPFCSDIQKSFYALAQDDNEVVIRETKLIATLGNLLCVVDSSVKIRMYFFSRWFAPFPDRWG